MDLLSVLVAATLILLVTLIYHWVSGTTVQRLFARLRLALNPAPVPLEEAAQETFGLGQAIQETGPPLHLEETVYQAVQETFSLGQAIQEIGPPLHLEETVCQAVQETVALGHTIQEMQPMMLQMWGQESLSQRYHPTQRVATFKGKLISSNNKILN